MEMSRMRITEYPKRTMTKNEYQEFVKECANKYWTVPGYNKKEMDAELDAVEILPFNLSRFSSLSESTKKWINILFKEEDTDRNGNYMLRGFTYHEREEVNHLNAYYGDYANAYSFYAYNDSELLIYTYCEGDTTLTLFETAEKYAKAKQETHDWYKEEYA